MSAYCGPNVNDNHVRFSFKDGAADIGRRSKRADLIDATLKRFFPDRSQGRAGTRRIREI
jgi:hypothetical protein